MAAEERNNNFDYDLTYTKILKARQNHARIQEKDFSHVFKKKSYLDVLRLSAFGIGAGVVFSAETAFVSPTLLQLGVEHTTMTMVWGLSPLLGLLLGPLCGSISDRCRLSLGRRRPVILLLTLGMLIGLICLPYGRNIGQLCGDDDIAGFQNFPSSFEVNQTVDAVITTLPTANRPNLKIAIILTILGVMLLDFSVETSQSPARAYMIDVCIPEDHNKVLSTFSVMIGVGSTVAYAIGGIDWGSTALGQLTGGNLPTVFLIDAFLLVVCFCITFFSFREIPLPLIEKDKLLQPLTLDAIKIESLTNNNDPQNNLFLISLSPKVNSDRDDKDPDSYSLAVKVDDANVEVETVSLGRYLKSIVVMPKSLWILCLTNLLSWMGHVCYCLYFTDFVGEAVFHGDPTAPVSSQKYNLYEDGVRFGGLGMAIYALSCSIYAFIIEKLMVWFKPKYIYIFGILIFAIGMFILAAWPSKLGVLLLSITAGIVYATIYTIPFIIVANYHAKGCFEMSTNGEYIQLKERRGLGTDMAIVNSMLFIAQLLISLSIGFLVSWMGTTKAIFYASSALSVCASVSAIFVLYI